MSSVSPDLMFSRRRVIRDELVGLYGVVERNLYLTKRYLLWDLAFLLWTIANTLSIVFISKAPIYPTICAIFLRPAQYLDDHHGPCGSFPVDHLLPVPPQISVRPDVPGKRAVRHEASDHSCLEGSQPLLIVR